MRNWSQYWPLHFTDHLWHNSPSCQAHKICKSRAKICKPKFLSHIINGHLPETRVAIDMECNMRVGECVEWMQSLIVILKVQGFVEVVVRLTWALEKLCHSWQIRVDIADITIIEPQVRNTNHSGQFEMVKLVHTVEITTSSHFVALIVSHLGRVFDFCYMGMLHDISRELDNSTIGLNIRHNTLHHLKFQDVPIVNWPVPLAYASICINYCRLVCMKPIATRIVMRKSLGIAPATTPTM